MQAVAVFRPKKGFFYVESFEQETHFQPAPSFPLICKSAKKKKTSASPHFETGGEENGCLLGEKFPSASYKKKRKERKSTNKIGLGPDRSTDLKFLQSSPKRSEGGDYEGGGPPPPEPPIYPSPPLRSSAQRTEQKNPQFKANWWKRSTNLLEHAPAIYFKRAFRRPSVQQRP